MQPLTVRLGDKVWFKGQDCEILAITKEGYQLNYYERTYGMCIRRFLLRNEFAIIWRDDISLESIIKGNFNE